VAIAMKRYLGSIILITTLGIFLLSCNTAKVIQTPLVLENQSAPTNFPFTPSPPTNTSTATARPTTPAYATFESANSTAEALGNICIGTKFITTIETSPNGKWIAATCDRENGADESPLQVSNIDHSQNWKIYYSDYIFSPSMDIRGLILDGDDKVIPKYWSKDGRFLFAIVGSRLDGCCWITGSRNVLLVRLNLETGEQVALLNTDYYSANVFSFIISDSDRYLLFTPPSYNLSYDFAVLDFQTWETKEIFLKVDKSVHMSYAKLSPKEDKVILPLFKFIPYDDYYVDSIALIDFVSGKQDILIANMEQEEEFYPTQWADDNHVLFSNINPVYYVGDKVERRWILDINSGQLKEESN
jgi:hypothetical protein